MTITSSLATSPLVARPDLSLRERKKLRTRATIQREALRLFREQGYSATTCEKIAAAADVSPATFFRYFPTKEDVVLSDDYDPLLLAGLAARPAEEGPLTAFREVIGETLSAVYATDEGALRERTRLVFAVPELRDRIYDQFRASAELLARELAPRMRADVGTLRARIVAGAIVATLMVAVETWAEGDGDLPAIALEALDVLGADLR